MHSLWFPLQASEPAGKVNMNDKVLFSTVVDCILQSVSLPSSAAGASAHACDVIDVICSTCSPASNLQDWDDALSFAATNLALSPCGNFLLVSTDGPRIVVFRTRGTAPNWHNCMPLLSNFMS